MERYNLGRTHPTARHDRAQLRVLPAQDRRPARAAGPYREQAQGLRAGIRVLHLRRRRLDVELYLRDGAPPQPAPRPAGRAAPVLRGRHARGNPRTAQAVPRHRRAAHRRPARRPALGHGLSRRPALRLGADRLHPRRAWRRLPHRGRRLPGDAPAGQRRAGRPAPFQGQDRCRRRRGHHPVLLQRRRLFPFRRCRAQAGRGRADHPRGDADVVAALCERLVAGGAPSLHFYTLNLAKPTSAVLQRIGRG